MPANPQKNEWMMHQLVMDNTHVDIYAFIHGLLLEYWDFDMNTADASNIPSSAHQKNIGNEE